MHTADCTLHTAHCRLHTSHCTLHTAQAAHYTLVHTRLHSGHYSLLTAQCALNVGDPCPWPRSLRPDATLPVPPPTLHPAGPTPHPPDPQTLHWQLRLLGSCDFLELPKSPGLYIFPCADERLSIAAGWRVSWTSKSGGRQFAPSSAAAAPAP